MVPFEDFSPNLSIPCSNLCVNAKLCGVGRVLLDNWLNFSGTMGYVCLYDRVCYPFCDHSGHLCGHPPEAAVQNKNQM